MRGWRAMVCAGCWMAAMGAMPAAAQTVPAAEKSVVKVPVWKQKEVSFRDPKPVVGLPVDHGHNDNVSCSSDGTNFVAKFDGADVEQLMSVYSVSHEGETKQLLRKLPPPSSVFISEWDTYATEHEFVTLLREEKREGDHPDGRVVDAHYFLSVTELDGSEGKLLSLDVRFKPLKIAMFGDESFLLLGMDEANLLPVLVLLKDDGTLRRFVDLDNRANDGGTDALSMKGAMKAETVALLERAKFTPFGNDVLLVQPGAASPVHDLSGVGGDRKIPVNYPAGWVMHDVLAGPWQRMMVVRMQPERSDKDKEGNYLRLFEVDAIHGSLVREFTFAMPSVTDVTCAPAGKLEAMYLRPMPRTSETVGEDGQKTLPKLELVVGTAPR